jgi:hypothetical protein
MFVPLGGYNSPLDDGSIHPPGMGGRWAVLCPAANWPGLATARWPAFIAALTSDPVLPFGTRR